MPTNAPRPHDTHSNGTSISLVSRISPSSISATTEPDISRRSFLKRSGVAMAYAAAGAAGLGLVIGGGYEVFRGVDGVFHWFKGHDSDDHEQSPTTPPTTSNGTEQSLGINRERAI